MSIANKLSLTIATIGISVLLLISIAIYKLNYDTLLESQLELTKSLSIEVSDEVNRLLYEKIKIAKTFIGNKSIIKALEINNNSFKQLADSVRVDSIKSLNDKWKSIKSETDSFILKYTDNNISKLLKNQQELLQGEYGEIFITNKYGSLIASTTKLSTLAHGHKYWWIGAYNNGEGSIFLDDRGYDKSVGGYVLGLVLPIKKNSKIIGIIKFNLNILGSISQLIDEEGGRLVGKYKLIRSKGLIVYKKGITPLSAKISNNLLKKLNEDKSYLDAESNPQYIISSSDIKLTTGIKGHNFGGKFETFGSNNGNTGETWKILCYRDLNVLEEPIRDSIESLIYTGLFLVFLLVFISLIFSKKFTKPLITLRYGAKRIGDGDFSYRIRMKAADEFSVLSDAFNKMATNLEERDIKLIKHTDKLKENNIELKNQKNVIEKANNLKDDFLANMSHELRTPLNSIISLSELLSDYKETGNIEDHKNYSKIIHRNGKKLLFMINDILDLSKIEAGKVDLSIEEISISKIIKDIIENHIAIVNKKNIYLTNKIERDIFIRSDEKRIYQILQNIINNAIKFTDSGGVTITGYSKSKYVVITISDTGIGISEEDLPEIFDVFKQLEGSLNRKFEGTGLGLSIVRKSINLLKGDLKVESTLNIGTTFTLQFPIEIS